MTSFIKRLSVILALISTCTLAADKINIDVHRYVSIKAWYVNSYIVESDSGLVLIDAQLLKSDARMLAAMMKTLNKPLEGVIITHAHADHFAGLAVLKDAFGDFPIIATKDTADGFKRYGEQFINGSLAPGFGDDVETRMVEPNRIVKSKEEIKLAGMSFVIDDLGAGEAENNVIVHQKELNVLFTGDTTMHRVHYYTGESRSEEVLSQFDHMKKHYDENTLMYAGHGEPARLNILDQMSEHVTYMRTLTADALSNPKNLNEKKDHLNQDARRSVIQKIKNKYPYFGDYGIGVEQVLVWNVWGIEAELMKSQKL